MHRSSGLECTGAGEQRPVTSAYDAIAADYDQLVHGDHWMRERLWQSHARAFPAGARVLDVACGTGIDAVFLARRGVRVCAVDVSPGMLAQLRAKVADEGLEAWVESRTLDLAELRSWPSGSFDGMISAFAGLNTLPDLVPFAADAARLVRTGGRVVLHLLNRTSLWEWLGLVARGRWGEAARLERRRRRSFVIGGTEVWHYPFRPLEAYRAFAPWFRLQRAYALGVLRPPHTLRRIPPWLAGALGRAERGAARHRPLLNWGRFFVLELVRK